MKTGTVAVHAINSIRQKNGSFKREVALEPCANLSVQDVPDDVDLVEMREHYEGFAKMFLTHGRDVECRINLSGQPGTPTTNGFIDSCWPCATG